MVALAKKPASLKTVPEFFSAHRNNQANWLTYDIGGQRVGLSKYRLYDADLGVFLSRDFLRYLNKYRAWSNNPVGQVDRDGLADETERNLIENLRKFRFDVPFPPGPKTPTDPEKQEDIRDLSESAKFEGGTTSATLKTDPATRVFIFDPKGRPSSVPPPGMVLATNETEEEYKKDPWRYAATKQAHLKIEVTLGKAGETACYYFNQKIKRMSTPAKDSDIHELKDDGAYYYIEQNWAGGKGSLTDNPGPSRSETATDRRDYYVGLTGVNIRPPSAGLSQSLQNALNDRFTGETTFIVESRLKMKAKEARPNESDPIVGTWEWEVKFKKSKDGEILAIPKKLTWKPPQ